MQLSLGPKKTTNTKPTTKKTLAAFSTGDSSDSDTAPPATTPPTKKKKRTAASVVNAQLSTFNSLPTAAPPPDADPSLYAYDTIYDTLKSADRKRAVAASEDALERKPKYMSNLLAAAEVRKRDALRANEKKLQREREAEGEEFEGKDAFVTAAYKKQQAELLELEKVEREKEEKLKKGSQGMTSFHRNMLDAQERRYEEVVTAAKEGAVMAEQTPELEETPKGKEPVVKGVEVNEEGAVVDKTQLLAGGLNITASKGPGGRVPVEARKVEKGAYRAGDKRQQQEEMRARQSRMIEEQLLQSQKRQLEEEDKSKEELARQTKSRKTETDVLSAKERYLQRKAAAAAEKKKE